MPDSSSLVMISAVLGAAVLGGWATHWFENRPRLITYLNQPGVLKSTVPNGPPIRVHTHSIVVRNAGSKSARNLRLGHTILPDYTVFPSMPVTEDRLADGTVDLVFDVLRPQEQMTISYLYFPPVVYDQINTHVKSDEDSAKFISVIPAQQPSKAVVRLAWFLMALGVATLIYLGYVTVAYLLVPMLRSAAI